MIDSILTNEGLYIVFLLASFALVCASMCLAAFLRKRDADDIRADDAEQSEYLSRYSDARRAIKQWRAIR